MTQNDSFSSLIDSSLHILTLNLQNLAISSDFAQRVGLAFGEGVNLVPLQQEWLTGEVELPDIEIVSSAEIAGANGAFSPNTGKIYLAQEFLSANNAVAVAGLLAEEYGHYVDTVVNTVDSAGDEGAIFARVVQMVGGGKSLY